MEQNFIVYESCRNLRALGRNALAGIWKLAFMGTLIYFAITTIPVLLLDSLFFEKGESAQSGIATIYSLLISGPMILGYAIFCISIF
ncbi:MAG: hypothetical protein PHE94_02120, partial [Eubacteriales bacterium]|nr:hypothetical protein [Eubacteriales bacterium]